ncbi:MAG TPA: thiamine pyrophosphate-dependent enzyme, partial [Polyangiaceae bacterium]|nr:thiamine pyrophosphate-dependent enzyme [Polyangiaceae bacterium]
NNHWAISLPVAKQSASLTIAVKGRAYGVPGVRADGNDVFAVHEVLKKAIASARSGGGPTLVELVTYRIAPHSTSDDPSRYRSNDDVEGWVRKDPMDRLVRYLREQDLLSPEAEASIDQELEAEIARAITEAESSAPPARSTMFDDVYEELPWHLVEERDELERTTKSKL